MRQEQERLLEISFGWQSGPALPSQRYLQERLLWLLFQQYPAMLFHGLPAWAGVGRPCQHRQSGNLSRSSIGGQRGGRRERDAVVGEEKWDTVQKGFWWVTECSHPNMFLSSVYLLSPPCSSHGAFAVQICRRRAEETPEPEQVPSERKAVAQRRRGRLHLSRCCSPSKCPSTIEFIYSERKLFHILQVQCIANQCCFADISIHQVSRNYSLFPHEIRVGVFSL